VTGQSPGAARTAPGMVDSLSSLDNLPLLAAHCELTVFSGDAIRFVVSDVAGAPSADSF